MEETNVSTARRRDTSAETVPNRRPPGAEGGAAGVETEGAAAGEAERRVTSSVTTARAMATCPGSAQSLRTAAAGEGEVAIGVEEGVGVVGEAWLRVMSSATIAKETVICRENVPSRLPEAGAVEGEVGIAVVVDGVGEETEEEVEPEVAAPTGEALEEKTREKPLTIN